MNLIELLEKITTDKRQRHLFAVACCREIWDLLTDQHSKHAVEIAELHADGLATRTELTHAFNKARCVASQQVNTPHVTKFAAQAAYWEVNNILSLRNVAYNCADAVAHKPANHTYLYSCWLAHMNYNTLFLQDIISNPSLAISPNLLSWNNSLLPKLANTVYTKKDFTLMPILADALQDANAPNNFIKHCRQPLHVKGCWLLDVLMGKR